MKFKEQKFSSPKIPVSSPARSTRIWGLKLVYIWFRVVRNSFFTIAVCKFVTRIDFHYFNGTRECQLPRIFFRIKKMFISRFENSKIHTIKLWARTLITIPQTQLWIKTLTNLKTRFFMIFGEVGRHFKVRYFHY